MTSEEGAIQQTHDLVAAVLERGEHSHSPAWRCRRARSRRVLVIKRRRKGLEYAVLPGGGVEVGETAVETALRELFEETSLTARVDSLLWHRSDDGREASYFLMSDVHGTPVLSGDEALEHGPDNSYVLAWSTVEELDELGLQPKDIRQALTALLRSLTPTFREGA